MQVKKEITHTNQEMEEEIFTFRKLITDWMNDILYALSYWRILLVAGILGAVVGLCFAWLRPVTYTARLTFVVEEAKGGGGSIASALAGQFGFDIGGISGASGILAGDNVMELLKSKSLIKLTLLTPFNDSANYSLADQYATVNHWKEKWRKSSKVGREINFQVNQKLFSRLEDSLLQRMINKIGEDELSISKPDKKLGFFEIQATTGDERFSQLFCERLLKITTDFYVTTKTKRLTNNVNRLQKRADSLGILLDKKTYSTAETEKLLLDANPVYANPMVNAEISSRNKFIQSTIYGEIIKNLEVSKTALIQETPTVQVVDSPELPLKENKTSWFIAAMAGGMISLLLCVFLIATRIGGLGIRKWVI